MNTKYEIQENFIPFGNIFNYVATSTWTGGGYFVYELNRNPKQNIFYVNENGDDSY